MTLDVGYAANSASLPGSSVVLLSIMVVRLLATGRTGNRPPFTALGVAE